MIEAKSQIILDEVLNNADNSPVQYFLRNNTLLKTKQGISSVDEHIIVYTLAKAQKQLVAMFSDKNKVYNSSDFPEEIVVTITNAEMKSLCGNKAYIGGQGLQRFCNSIGGLRMNFVSYIDGYYTNTALIKSFKWKNDTPDEIRAVIDKEVYLYLVDYTLNLRDNNIIIDEIKTSKGLVKKENNSANADVIENDSNIFNKPKEYVKGYSKVELRFYKEIKNVYARNIFLDLKAAIENNWIYNNKIKTIEKTYTLDYLRERFMLENKYTRFSDFNSRVLKTAKKQINDSGYMNMDYSLQSKKAQGGDKVVAVTFKATITEKLLNLDDKYNKINVDISKERKSVIKHTLGESLSAKLKTDARLNVGAKSIDEMIELYGEELVRKSVMALLAKNEEERVRAPKKYLLAVLADMEEKKYMIKRKAEIELEQQELGPVVIGGYDVNQLELDLLGWND